MVNMTIEMFVSNEFGSLFPEKEKGKRKKRNKGKIKKAKKRR